MLNKAQRVRPNETQWQDREAQIKITPEGGVMQTRWDLNWH